jgi:nitrite reductase/ring-hydroxylating ferredoxin subunit
VAIFDFELSEVIKNGPQRIELSVGQFCFVVCEDGEVVAVLKDKCSHMGSTLNSSPKGFSCKTHGWMFDARGKNLVESNPGLTELQFEIQGDLLRVFAEETVDLLPESGDSKLDGTESLELLAHASFVLRSGQTNVLFDPWFVGDAYWGSWTLWPKNEVSKEQISNITHVVVTHAHPDHFNLESLDKLNRSVAFLFPDFLSGIIPKTLSKMGFTNIKPVAWETKVDLGSEVSLAFLRPNTVWEDSSVLVRVKDWVWLNQNDAGAPLADNLVPHNIDLLSSSFDTGASGYPLTYEMSLLRKTAIVKNSKIQILTSIAQRCEQVGAKFFAPFAGWWRHGLEEHQETASHLDHTTLEDLDNVLASSPTVLLPTIPSSKVNLKSMALEYDEVVYKRMNEPVEVGTLDSTPGFYSDEQLLEKLHQLQNKLAALSSATRSENVMFKITVTGIDGNVSTEFGKKTDNPVELSVTISRRIAELLVSGDPAVTWNHIDIGYWGNWHRNSDSYPSNFMRLLHLGYVQELESTVDVEDANVLNLSVADVIKANPDLAGRILARAGLPCIACGHQVSETLGQAMGIHSVGSTQKSIALAELSSMLSSAR